MLDAGCTLARQMLAEDEKITAIFTRNDFIAVGALKALKEVGAAVPEDVSVIGYADTILARSSSPELTSVRTPIGKAGAIAVERLVEAIEKGAEQFPGTMLPTSLTIRCSCAEAPTQYQGGDRTIPSEAHVPALVEGHPPFPIFRAQVTQSTPIGG
jgi:LacI family transcriptional regulator